MVVFFRVFIFSEGVYFLERVEMKRFLSVFDFMIFCCFIFFKVRVFWSLFGRCLFLVSSVFFVGFSFFGFARCF